MAPTCSLYNVLLSLPPSSSLSPALSVIIPLGSCPDLIMKKDEQPPVALTPLTPQRAQHLPHLSLSFDSSSPQRALDTREWKSNPRVQVRVAVLRIPLSVTVWLPHEEWVCSWVRMMQTWV